ncbi:MAG TPA: hypothetical protein PKO36_08980 [Candidatus Hydrogenedentes bacterium]|nr:hypothetical protein [Candidatus Hydrogenedentota bacterium]HOV73226.1 hypothetical protein [Candidatus Hydrogenedentota bacterium]
MASSREAIDFYLETLIEKGKPVPGFTGSRDGMRSLPVVNGKECIGVLQRAGFILLPASAGVMRSSIVQIPML